MRIVSAVIALALCAATARAAELFPAATPIEIPTLTLAPNYLQITLIFEDDGTFVRPLHGTDRHYTAGESVTAAFQIPLARTIGAIIPSYGNEFDPADFDHTTYALGITASQQMFSPADISNPNPIPTDRPYAGYLYGGLFLQRAFTPPPAPDAWLTLGVFEHFELDLGMIGPAAQGRQTQQYVHREFDAATPDGWGNQLHDEFGFNAKYTRKWRLDLLPAGTPIGLQLIPQAGATVGTFDRNAAASLTARLGFNLPDDFGPVRIADLPSATARSFHDLGGYAFLRAGGRLVEHNTTLQGNNFRDYPLGVEPEPAVGEINTGFALQFFKHVEFGWNWTFESKEFKGQDGPDAYGTMYLSAFWQF
jgi:hypothetical protein